MVRALRGYFAPPPPYEAKNVNCFSRVSSYYFMRTIAQVLKSSDDSIFTVAMVIKSLLK